MASDASHTTLGQQYTVLANSGESRSMEFVSSSEGKVSLTLPSSELVTSSEPNQLIPYVLKRNASKGDTNCDSDESSMMNSKLGSVSSGWAPNSQDDFQPRNGAQPTSEVHNFSGVDECPPIPPEEYPAQFKEQQYDAVLIYSESKSDRLKALNFKDIIEKFIVLEDGTHPMVCILDRGDNLPHIQSRFRHAEEALERSTYMFLLLTKDFVNDSWAEMQKDECLMLSIQEPKKKWCVVPLFTKQEQDMDFRCPYGLRALKGLNIFAMLKQKDLEKVDPAKIDKDDLDPYFVQNLTKMFNYRLGDKRERQRQQEYRLREWICNEKKIRLKNQLEMKRQIKQQEMDLKKMIEKEKEKLHNISLSDGSHDDIGRRPTSNVDNTKSGKGDVVIHNYGNIQIGGNNVYKKYQTPMHNCSDSTCSSVYSVEENTDDIYADTPVKCHDMNDNCPNPETCVKEV